MGPMSAASHMLSEREAGPLHLTNENSQTCPERNASWMAAELGPKCRAPFSLASGESTWPVRKWGNFSRSVLSAGLGADHRHQPAGHHTNKERIQDGSLQILETIWDTRSPGWGLTLAGPACAGGVGVPGRPAPTGVGALEVDALGSRGAVVPQAVCTLVPICRGNRRDTGQSQ